MIKKLVIIGVGLIGGSLAKALKNKKAVSKITGYSRSETHLQQAVNLKIIDDYSLDIAIAMDNADVIVIATPVQSFAAIFKDIKPYFKPNMVLTDVGSTKGSVIKMIKGVFGDIPKNFIPAHPIAGKEKSGALAADGALFNNRRVILTYHKNATDKAIKKVTKMWQDTGAIIETMSVKKHDELLAMTSHLPHLLSFSLMNYLTDNNPNAYDYAAGGFKDFSRIASSDSIMWRDIFINNDKALLKEIAKYQKSLANIATLIKNKDTTKLEQELLRAKQLRDNWIENHGDS